MLISIGFWIYLLYKLVHAADGDYCSYNSLGGFCVTLDAQGLNQQCHAAHGWLQLYISSPPPREYMGCGDDGVV
jgi:hypothetical protein